MSSEVGSERVVLDALLELQERDTAIDRLRHRRAALPERAVLERAEAALADVSTSLGNVTERRDDLSREERRFDDEAKTLEERAAEVERRMYSGEIGSPRELQAMQADVEQLRRHRRGLEDRELAVMEQRELLDQELGRRQTTAAELEAEAGRAREALDQQETAIDADLDVETAARDEIAAGIEAGLLEEYEGCRRRARGIGAARLVGGTCQGCHLSIPATEAERIRKSPPGTVAHCDNCGCLLVA